MLFIVLELKSPEQRCLGTVILMRHIEIYNARLQRSFPVKLVQSYDSIIRQSFYIMLG